MATLDKYLRSVVRRVKQKFPDAGILIVTVDEPEDEPELTYFSNMEPDEMQEVLGILVQPEPPDSDPFEDIVYAGQTLH